MTGKASGYDYIIIGSGIAGLYTALLAQKHGSVLVITKGVIDDCNTRFAQGGIAAAIGRDDSPDLHFADTIKAGDGLCDEEAVRILVDQAADAITDLVDLSVPFDTLDGQIALTREAAHSRSRILHAGGDTTGEYIEVTLSNNVVSHKIRVLEHSLVTRIITDGNAVIGVEVLDVRTSVISGYECRHLILATGGAGQLYKVNTNSDVATGDGVALAYQAGAEIVDMEFYQFHPTALHLPGVTPFLITEAVRGEGGVLRNSKGRRFMQDYSPEADLAPRDIVSRSILSEMEKTSADNVFLDVTHLPVSLVTTRFPNIYRFCREHGLTITQDLIPVAPAAHYMIGGVKTNTWGETSISRLYACGEVACTGVHGANRLASNSLLEGLVYSKRIIQRTTGVQNGKAPVRSQESHRYPVRRWTAKQPVPEARVSALQQILWDRVGIKRTREGLIEAAGILAAWQENLPPPTDRPSFELCNLVQTGRLVTEAALLREESRGAHFRVDFPRKRPALKHHNIFTNSG